MDEPTVDQEKEREKMESLVSDLIQGVAPANKPIPIFKGRKKIYTNYINKEQVGDEMTGFKKLDKNNIVRALNLALKTHYKNAYDF